MLTKLYTKLQWRQIRRTYCHWVRCWRRDKDNEAQILDDSVYVMRMGERSISNLRSLRKIEKQKLELFTCHRLSLSIQYNTIVSDRRSVDGKILIKPTSDFYSGRTANPPLPRSIRLAGTVPVTRRAKHVRQFHWQSMSVSIVQSSPTISTTKIERRFCI